MKTTNLNTKTRGATLDQREELKLLRSFVIGIAGNDPEGDYRPEFVERLFVALKEQPEYKFTDSNSFLNRLRKSI